MQFFQPELALQWIPATRSYVLKSRTLVPSGHYSAGPAQEGVTPAGISLIPEALGVVLDINYFAGPATHAAKVLPHDVPLTRLNQTHQLIVVFNVIQGAMVGAASIGVPDKSAAFALTAPDPSLTASAFAAPQALAVPNTSWTAWISSMPPWPRSLHVVGFLTVPNPGVRASLRRAVPPGINPKILILEVVFEQSSGASPQIPISTAVGYTERPYTDCHTECTIRWPSGATVNVPILEVS